MTLRRRWLLAMLAVVLIGAATPIALVLLPCKSHGVMLLNASRWRAQVTLQTVISTWPRHTVWSGTVESHAPPHWIPVAMPGEDGHYSLTLHFPETGRSIPELQFGYITPHLLGVEFLLIRDEDIVHAFWHDPPRTRIDEPMSLWSSLWDVVIFLLSDISCLDG